jgi:hypothetical protein
VAVFPVATESSAAHGTVLGQLLEPFHGIGRGRLTTGEERSRTWCRDLAQGVTQYFGLRTAPGKRRGLRKGPFGGDPRGRLTVFISHTNEVDDRGTTADAGIVDRVRSMVQRTRLDKFFSASDLQPGQNWGEELARKAASSALLAVRTSTYASRPWCQREMLLAKTSGMPIVVLDALEHPEERGSFLMDHVPRVPVRRDGDGWCDDDILAGLNLLVDECLKHALWHRQGQLVTAEMRSALTWWSPHAPEPVTLVPWLQEQVRRGRLPARGTIQVIHPDPPIGDDEARVLEQIVRLAGLRNELDIVTPRVLAARAP